MNIDINNNTINLSNIINLTSIKKLYKYYLKQKQSVKSIIFFDNSNQSFSNIYKDCKNLFKSNNNIESINVKQKIYSLCISVVFDNKKDLYNLFSDYKKVYYKINHNQNIQSIFINLNKFNIIEIAKDSINNYQTNYNSKIIYKVLINDNNIYFNTYNNKYAVLNTKRLSNILYDIKNYKLLKLYIDILYDILNINKKYIGKDIYNMLYNNKIILPSINMVDINKYYNKNQLFKKLNNINYNKYDINFDYIYNKLAKYIVDNHLDKFKLDLKECLNNVDNDFLIKLKFNKIYNLLTKFITKIYFNKTNNIERLLLVDDFVKLCKQNNSKINIKNIHNINKLHDEQVKIFNSKKIKKMKIKFNFHNKFNNLIKTLPKKYKLLKSETELYLEGQNQHNCVYTYLDKIIKDKSIIYHYKNYTIEIGYKYKKYELLQFYGEYNKTPNETDVNELNYIIDNINKIN